ncbi:MAG: ATP phosphoribosyltransferase regulatory subunit [Eubacteriales bacterium]|nr:ATP phosphoribosyltransferase regulatory subunit [Eubacteriales bacterium]MDO5586321.1 ATP phosphoribosyltransferase regulatory subunit [Clostridia bacterium]MDY4214253.1 ATP phosphoribosyltransferase regulatory subunit [Eubacteriales bacterium]
MQKSGNTHTPAGLTDILVKECELKFKIETAAREVFARHGYHVVQPPMFEYYDVYDAAVTKAENMFKFFDNNGRMLALRPDLTTSVARIAATKPLGELPYRIAYSGSAFRNDETFSNDRRREFSQAGIELIGNGGTDADAEVIEIAIETLLKFGVKDFQIDMGHADYYKGLAEIAGLDPIVSDKLRANINDKDFVAIEGILDGIDIDEKLKEVFMELPKMFGGIETAVAAAKNPIIGEKSRAALENLISVYEILKGKGLDKYISTDLGMVPNLDYYTGIIVKGFAKGVAFPICSGGRYDNLTEKFGKALPATGIAIGIERVMTALSDIRERNDENASEYITVALAKGRLAELSINIFEKLGFDVQEMKSKTRKLIFTDEKNKFKFILVKASDVPVYVEYGAADIGVVGKDTLLESGKDVYEIMDLGFGKCRMAVAGPSEMRDKLVGRNIMRVASKYPHIARDYFHRVKGQTVDIIKLNGSVELGPLVGLSDVIVDIVESGKTLKENGLEVLEDVCELSARLVVNRVSLKMHRERILKLMSDIKSEL